MALLFIIVQVSVRIKQTRQKKEEGLYESS